MCIFVLTCKSVNALFQLKTVRTGAVAASPAPGVLQRNESSPVQASCTDVVLSERCVLAAWHGWGVGSSAQLLLYPFCVGSVFWCEPALFSTESVLQWLPALRRYWECSVCGFSLGQPLSSIPCCHCLFFSVSQFFTA